MNLLPGMIVMSVDGIDALTVPILLHLRTAVEFHVGLTFGLILRRPICSVDLFESAPNLCFRLLQSIEFRLDRLVLCSALLPLCMAALTALEDTSSVR